MYGSVFARTSAPWSTACGGIPCVMSMTCASGAIRLITPWQVPTKSSWSPKSVRKVMNTAPSLRRARARARPRSTRPVEVVRLGLGDDVDARRARPPGRLRPDRDGGRRAAERGVAPARPTADARTTRSHVRQAAGVELDACGRAATKSAPSASASSRRAPSAPANSTRPAGVGSSASRPSWVEARGDEVGAAERVGRRPADRGDAPRRRRASGAAARARRSRS